MAAVRDATSTEAFVDAWLTLQCRTIGEVSRAVVVLGEPETEPYTAERMKSFIHSAASATARRALWRESQGRGCACPAPEGH